VMRAVESVAGRQSRFPRDLIERSDIDPELRAHAEALLSTAGRRSEYTPVASVTRGSAIDVLEANPPRRRSPQDETDASQNSGSAAANVEARRRAHAALRNGAGDEGARPSLATIAATLRGANARRFMLEALEHEAAADGNRAFTEAVSLDEPLRTATLLKVGAAWASHDARAALAAADRLLSDPRDLHALRFQYALSVLETWSRIDTLGVARHFETMELDEHTLSLINHFGRTICAHPDSARIIAARVPSSYREGIFRRDCG